MSYYTKSPLPLCDGPQLELFHHSTAHWEYRDLPDTGGDSCVMKVLIDGQAYAIKVFKHYDISSEVAMINDYDEQELPQKLIYCHTAPFFRECRAHGALIKAKLDGRYAARCYGYLAIPVDQAKTLIQLFPAIESWNVPEAHSSESRPAIVKEMLEEPSQSNHEADNEAIKDLHEAGIYKNGNVQLRNLKNGKIFSFSHSETEPFFRDKLRSNLDAQYHHQYDSSTFERRE